MNLAPAPLLLAVSLIASAWESMAAPAPDRPTLFLIGDSTVRNGHGDGAGDLWGWGDFLGTHFDTNRVQIANRALGGRSSRTFFTEGLWEKVRQGLRPGDFVLMQFGHNDGGQIAKGDRPRASLPGNGNQAQKVIVESTGKTETVQTYGWYLRRYISDTKAARATPVVLSPVPRNIWKEGKVVRASNDYGKWSKEAAKGGKAAFIDLNDLAARRYEEAGEDVVSTRFFTSQDHTHTTLEGAKLNAERVASGLRSLPALMALLSGSAVPNDLSRGSNLQTYTSRATTWFGGLEARQVLDNVLSWQSPLGDWPKNLNTAAASFTGDRTQLRGTFDNGATTSELRFLARSFQVRREHDIKEAFLRGLDHILNAQYTNGGWPQFSPPPTSTYHRHITFNDDTMRRLLEFVRDVAQRNDFDFVDAERRRRAEVAFDRGIACILACQIKVDGKLTAWCAQHDAITLEPRPGRTFELVSLSGAESAGILVLLMTIHEPSDPVKRAVESAAEWYRSVQLHDLRVLDEKEGIRTVEDSKASPSWARFYEIGSNRPIFAGRDGQKKFALAEIEAERRNGYAWYGRWGEAVAREFALWKRHQRQR